MLENSTKQDLYSHLSGKLATTLKEIAASSENGIVTIPAQSIILLLEVDLIEKHVLSDRSMSFEQKLHWITFKADFDFKALFGEKTVEFTEKKLAIVPKMD